MHQTQNTQEVVCSLCLYRQPSRPGCYCSAVFQRLQGSAQPLVPAVRLDRIHPGKPARSCATPSVTLGGIKLWQPLPFAPMRISSPPNATLALPSDSIRGAPREQPMLAAPAGKRRRYPDLTIVKQARKVKASAPGWSPSISMRPDCGPSTRPGLTAPSRRKRRWISGKTPPEFPVPGMPLAVSLQPSPMGFFAPGRLQRDWQFHAPVVPAPRRAKLAARWRARYALASVLRLARSGFTAQRQRQLPLGIFLRAARVRPVGIVDQPLLSPPLIDKPPGRSTGRREPLAGTYKRSRPARSGRLAPGPLARSRGKRDQCRPAARLLLAARRRPSRCP